jgi:amino acid transporter
MIEDAPVDALPQRSTEVTLSGSLGTLDIVFTVLAYNAPLTVITGYVPLILAKGNGLGAPITFLVAGGIIALFAVGFSTMSKHVPNAGAFYAYIAAGLGKPFGLGSAFVAILAYALMMIGIYLYGGVVYGFLAKEVLGHSPLLWWQWSLILWVVVSVLGYLRISFSAKVLTYALIMEVLLVFGWEIAILVHKGFEGISPSWLSPSNVTSGSLGVAILLGVGSYAGFEATAIFREEARSPETTVPRATYLAVIVMTATFASAAYFMICGYGPQQALARAAQDPSVMTMNSMRMFLGRAGLEAVNTLVCSSVFACLLALHNILSRYIYSLGVDGTLPKIFAAVHSRYGSPYRASVLVSLVGVSCIAVTMIGAVEPFAWYGILSGSGGYALLLLQILTSLSIIAFFRHQHRTIGRWRTLYAPLASTIALVATGWLATTNLDLLTGSAQSIVILPVAVMAFLIVGIAYAMRLRKTHPAAYRAIGRQKI